MKFDCTELFSAALSECALMQDQQRLRFVFPRADQRFRRMQWSSTCVSLSLSRSSPSASHIRRTTAGRYFSPSSHSALSAATIFLTTSFRCSQCCRSLSTPKRALLGSFTFRSEHCFSISAASISLRAGERRQVVRKRSSAQLANAGSGGPDNAHPLLRLSQPASPTLLGQRSATDTRWAPLSPAAPSR
jgi:hypothetical protein